MFALENILSQELVQKLGWTLLHFIWQATAVALLAAVLLRILRRFSANLRYVTACLALGLIVLLPIVTIQLIPVSSPPKEKTEFRIPDTEGRLQIAELQPSVISPPSSVLEEPVRREPARTNYFAAFKQKTAEVLEPALPHIVTVWLLGVFALSIWHLGGWTQLQRLRKKMVRQVDNSLKTKLNRLSEKLGIKQAVELLESALVQIPTVVGWMKPVILLPASALTGLNAEQLEAILAHELAHIKRFDYLVNMLQTIVEILGFYHPAVWWVSHKIRAERENCCDDLAVAVCGDKINYAKALTSMEEIRGGKSDLAVAATGGNLFSRIRRLIGKDSNEKTLSWFPAVTVILLLVALIISTTLAITTNEKPENEPSNAEKIDSSTKILIETQIIHVDNEFLKQVGLDADSLKYSNSWAQYRVDDSSNPTMFVIDSHTKEILLKNVDESISSSSISRIFLMAMSGREAMIKNYSGYDFKSQELGRFIKIIPELSPDGQSTSLDCELMTRRFENFDLFSDVYINKKVDQNVVSESEIIEYKVNAENALLSDDHTLLILGGKLVSLRDVENRQPVLRHIPVTNEFYGTTSKIEGQANEIILIKTNIVSTEQNDDIDSKASSDNVIKTVDPMLRIYLDLDLEAGQYVEIKDSGKRAPRLKQVTADSIGKNARKDFPAYASYIDFEIRSNFDLNLATQRYTRGSLFEHDKWDAYFTGPDTIIGDGNFSPTILCVSAWKLKIWAISPLDRADDTQASLVAVIIKPDNEQSIKWGEAVDGLQYRLKPERLAWKQGQSLRFSLDIRNSSPKSIRVHTNDLAVDFWLEMDGVIYFRYMQGLDNIGTVLFPPGDTLVGISFVVSESRDYNSSESLKEPRQFLKLTPGKHTIRIARSRNRSDLPPVLFSNPVEIEILPDEDTADVQIEDKLDLSTDRQTTEETLQNDMVNRIYDISDLEGIPDDVNNFILRIIETIEPESWQENGGTGTITAFPANEPKKLAVYHQSRQVHQKIKKLRELWIDKTSVQIEMRFLHTSEEFMDEHGEELNLKDGSRIPLDDLQVGSFLKAAQANEGTKMVATPQVMVLDNQEAQISIHTELPYVSGYTEPNSPAEEPKPIIDYKMIGTTCDITPHVSPDRQNVYMEFELDISQLIGFEERIFQGKYKEQVPRIETKTIATSIATPDGKTLLIDGGPITSEEEDKSDSPEEKKRLIILIKPTILSPEQTEELGLDSAAHPAMMGGYGQGELPPGFGGMGGSGYGTLPPEILKLQSAGKPMILVYHIADLAETADDVNNLIRRIKDIIEPESWYKAGGGGIGTITAFPSEQPKKLLISQSVQVHQKIQKFLDIMRPSSGEEDIRPREVTFPENWDEIMRRRESNEKTSSSREKTREQIIALTEKLKELETQRNILEAQALIHAKSRELSANRQETINNLPTVQAMAKKLAEVEKELIEARQTLTESHPKVQQLIKIKEILNKELDRIKATPLEDLRKQEYIRNDPTVNALSEEWGKAYVELFEARQTYTESHPKVRQLIELQRDLNKRRSERRQEVGRSYDQDMNTKDRRKKLDDLRASLEQVKAEVQQLRDTLEKEDTESAPQPESRQEQRGTVAKEPTASKLVNRVYDITDLVGLKRDEGEGGYSGGLQNINSVTVDQNSIDACRDIINLIKDLIEPDSWYDNNNKALGTIFAYPAQQPKKLAVYQSVQVHQKIEKLLGIMRPSSGEEYIAPREVTFPKNWDAIKKQAESAEAETEKPESVKDQEYVTLSLKYISPDEAAELINKSLSSQDTEVTKKIFIQPLVQSHQLLVFGDERNRQMVKDILIEIDVPSSDSNEAIMIETRIVKASDEFLEFIGLDDKLLDGSSQWSKYLVTDSNDTPRFIIDKLNADLLTKTARARKDNEMLTSPGYCLSGKQVTISIVDQKHYILRPPAEPNDPAEKRKTELLKTGTSIQLSPKLMEDRKIIQLDYVIKINHLIEFQEQKIGDTKMLTPKVSTFKDTSRTLIPYGHTLLIRGEKIIETIERQESRPMLDLPLIDRLFRTKSKIKIMNEYTPLILIHPTIPSQRKVKMRPATIQRVDPNDPVVKQLEKRLRR